MHGINTNFLPVLAYATSYMRQNSNICIGNIRTIFMNIHSIFSREKFMNHHLLSRALTDKTSIDVLPSQIPGAV